MMNISNHPSPYGTPYNGTPYNGTPYNGTPSHGTPYGMSPVNGMTPIHGMSRCGSEERFPVGTGGTGGAMQECGLMQGPTYYPLPPQGGHPHPLTPTYVNNNNEYVQESGQPTHVYYPHTNQGKMFPSSH